MDPSDPSRDQVGELRYLGGFVLQSDDPNFGGISALVVDGDRFTAIGDAGGLFGFSLDDAGAVTQAEISILPDGPKPVGGGEPQKADRDAESVVYDPVTERYWVGFERAHAIWRYGAGFGPAQAGRAPEEMAVWPSNSGAEAMLLLPDGGFMVFSEGGQGPDDSSEAFLFASDPTQEQIRPVRFGYRPPEGYQITDAVLLPDGRALLLNRRFTFPQGLSAILSVASLDEVQEGDVLEGHAVAALDYPATVDNMEALAVTQEDGRTIIWVASDNNFNPLQRTLLLKFELQPAN